MMAHWLRASGLCMPSALQSAECRIRTTQTVLLRYMLLAAEPVLRAALLCRGRKGCVLPRFKALQFDLRLRCDVTSAAARECAI